jgi:hypothetical protein
MPRVAESPLPKRISLGGRNAANKVKGVPRYKIV